MSIIDDTHELVAREPVFDGFVIAFQSKGGATDPFYRTLFVQPLRGSPGVIRGGNLGDATIYPTYHAASVAASSWSHTKQPGTRIIHIKRVCPYIVMEDLPANILDAIVEGS